MSMTKIRTDMVAVAGNDSAKVQVISESGPFRLHEICLSPEVGRNFFITDIKVCKNSQFISPGAVPASFLTSYKHQENLYYDCLPRGMVITFNVSNLSSEAKVFEAVLGGEVVVEGSTDVRALSLRKRTFVGLGHTIVVAGGSCNVNLQPQVQFEPDLLVLPPEILVGLQVVDVRVVGESVLESVLEKVTELSKEETVLRPRKMKISDWLCVSVKNKTDVTRAFYGTVVGTLLPPV